VGRFGWKRPVGLFLLGIYGVIQPYWLVMTAVLESPRGGEGMNDKSQQLGLFEGDIVPVVCRLSPASLDDLSRIESESSQAPWSRKFFAYEFENTFSRTYGARVGAQLVGFVVIHVVADEVHIVNLAVDQRLRRRGVARQLVLEVLDDLHCQGAEWVYLEVRVGNQAAISLYEKLGFYRAGLRRKYYSDNGEDAVLMTLKLGELMARRSGEVAA